MILCAKKVRGNGVYNGEKSFGTAGRPCEYEI